MYNAIRWHEHGQIVGSHFETRQPASPPSKRSDELWVATIEVQLIKKNLPSWFADRSPCGRWSAYWKKVCPMKTRAEFPIATVDYKRVSMSLSENGRQNPVHGSHDHPFPHQVRPRAVRLVRDQICHRSTSSSQLLLARCWYDGYLKLSTS